MRVLFVMRQVRWKQFQQYANLPAFFFFVSISNIIAIGAYLIPDLAPTDEARPMMRRRLRDDDVSTHGTIS